MLGQVLRVKGYYDVMIHKHHSEGVYDLIDLRVGRTHLKGLTPKMSYLISIFDTYSREKWPVLRQRIPPLWIPPLCNIRGACLGKY